MYLGALPRKKYGVGRVHGTTNLKFTTFDGKGWDGKMPTVVMIDVTGRQFSAGNTFFLLESGMVIFAEKLFLGGEERRFVERLNGATFHGGKFVFWREKIWQCMAGNKSVAGKGW